MIRLGLHPPRPAVRINNNLLLWSSVSYSSRDRIDSFSSPLRRRRNMSELDRRSGSGFMRLATVQHNAENQQQRSLQEHRDQQSQSHVTHYRPPDAKGERRPAAFEPKSYRTEAPVCTFNQVRPPAMIILLADWRKSL
jgi:hypothetical protein